LLDEPKAESGTATTVPAALSKSKAIAPNPTEIKNGESFSWLEQASAGSNSNACQRAEDGCMTLGSKHDKHVLIQCWRIHVHCARLRSGGTHAFMPLSHCPTSPQLPIPKQADSKLSCEHVEHGVARLRCVDPPES
jgi:hypothetical protein